MVDMLDSSSSSTANRGEADSRFAPPSERALRRGHGAFRARVGLDRHPERAGEGLEDGLRLVVRVRAAQPVDVQGDLRVVDETLEELVHEVDVELADPRAHKRHVELEPGAAGEVDHHARERLVERNVGVAEAAHPLLVAERLRDRLTDRDPDVLHGVVRVDVQVACRGHIEVEQPMASHLVEHVVEKRNACRERRLPGAVEVHRDGDLRLGGVAGDRRFPHRLSARAAASNSFSPGVPTVSRRQLARSGWLPWKLRTRILRSLRRASTASASGTRTRMKLASLGNTTTPSSSRRRSSSAARSALMRSACPCRTSMWASTRSAIACASTLTLYGGRILSSSRIHSGLATAYPSRTPASPSFETVRMTIRFSNSASCPRNVLPANTW